MTLLIPRLLQYAACAAVVWIAWMVLSVRRIDLDTFDRHAIEIERTQTWRYGYVGRYQDWWLVRARLEAGAPPLTHASANNTIAPAMVRALHQQRRAAAVGSVLYGSLWVICFNGVLRIRRRLASNAARRLQRLRAVSSTPQYTG